MDRFKLIAGVTLVFVVGAFVGAIGSGFYYRERLKNFMTGGPPTDVKIRMLLDKFSHDLELTDTQLAEIEKILRDAQDKVFELRRETFPQIEELNEKSLELIKEKLDKKQKEKFNRFYSKMKEMHDRFAVKLDFPGRPPEPDINEMKDLLGLTSEQISEIREIMDQGFKERESIMEADRGKQPPDFSQIRQKMMDSEKAQRKRIQDILTTGQMEAYRKYLEERRSRRPPPGPPPAPFDDSPPPPPGQRMGDAN